MWKTFILSSHKGTLGALDISQTSGNIHINVKFRHPSGPITRDTRDVVFTKGVSRALAKGSIRLTLASLSAISREEVGGKRTARHTKLALRVQ